MEADSKCILSLSENISGQAVTRTLISGGRPMADFTRSRPMTLEVTSSQIQSYLFLNRRARSLAKPARRSRQSHPKVAGLATLRSHAANRRLAMVAPLRRGHFFLDSIEPSRPTLGGVVLTYEPGIFQFEHCRFFGVGHQIGNRDCCRFTRPD